MNRIAAEKTSAFGQQIKQWRRRRGVSQLDLATLAGLSQRYVSFIETGRSRPGEDVVLRVAEALELPIRERNGLLLAAGLPPKFPELPINHTNLAPFRAAISRMIENHDPFPAYVVNRWWDVVDANRAGSLLFPTDSVGTFNAVDVFFAPGPARDMVENFDEIAYRFLQRLRQEVSNCTPDERLQAVLERAENYLKDIKPDLHSDNDTNDLVLCPRLRIGDQVIRTLSMVARFGDTREVNLDELRVELLFPADEQAEAFFNTLPMHE